MLWTLLFQEGSILFTLRVIHFTSINRSVRKYFILQYRINKILTLRFVSFLGHTYTFKDFLHLTILWYPVLSSTVSTIVPFKLQNPSKPEGVVKVTPWRDLPCSWFFRYANSTGINLSFFQAIRSPYKKVIVPSIIISFIIFYNNYVDIYYPFMIIG